MAWKERGLGEVSGCISCHVSPSQIQVSLSAPTEQNDVPGVFVEGHTRRIARRWQRTFDLKQAPLFAIPYPTFVEGFKRCCDAAKHEDLLAQRIIYEAVMGTRRR